MAVAGEVTWHGRAHPYSWSVTIFSLNGLESDKMNHRSEWKPNSWGMFLNIGVSTRQAPASHTSTQYKVYKRPCRITRSFLAVLCHFWHLVFPRKICRQLRGHSDFGQYSLCVGIFFQSLQGHLGDMGQLGDLVSLLLWEFIVDVMDTPLTSLQRLAPLALSLSEILLDSLQF